MKKQTGVEWLIEQVNNKSITHQSISIRIDIPKEIIDQALTIERENSEISFFAGFNYEGGHPIDKHEEFYNKTYNS